MDKDSISIAFKAFFLIAAMIIITMSSLYGAIVGVGVWTFFPTAVFLLPVLFMVANRVGELMIKLHHGEL